MYYVIGIDISKDTSQVMVAVDGKVTQHFNSTHDVMGFNQLNTIIIQLNEFPDIVFESTGIYSRHLRSFLDWHNYTYNYLNPLAVKNQLDQLRLNKNDVNGSKNLADTQFILARAKRYVQNLIYIELQDMSHFYQKINRDIVSIKNRLYRILQLTFPEIEGLFTTTDSSHYWAFLTIMPPATITKRSKQALMDTTQSLISCYISHTILSKLIDVLVSCQHPRFTQIIIMLHKIYTTQND